MTRNGNYSGKDFTHKTFTDTDPAEWNNTEVVGSCFYQEEPGTRVFPDGIRGVKFIECNLDNCVLPVGCTMEGGTNKRIRMQKDLEDWILDESLNPVEPTNKTLFIKLGLSTSPIDIPVVTANKSVTQVKFWQLEEQLEVQLSAAREAIENTATWRE